MPKNAKTYVCAACNETAPKWTGKCPACGEWNTLEERAAAPTGTRLGGKSRGAVSFSALDGAGAGDHARIATGLPELDRVLGGGLVPGSAILISGEPGIGKSTLLLQAMAALKRAGYGAAYVSGEESEHQIRRRAARLGVENSGLLLAAENDVEAIAGSLIGGAGKIDAIVVDSIQTLYHPAVEAVPGTVSQVRSSVNDLIRAAKKANACVVMVGHVTKEGAIAGPKAVEHLVDACIFFEAEQSQRYRILRATKNRFGAADEIGVFEMTGTGLVEVPNPSGIFLTDRQAGVAGSVVYAGVEGSRPILLEIQALVSPNPHGTPRRVSVGFDSQRLAMIIAVLEARCGLALSANDVFLNVAGGFKITEPAADLAVAAALISSISGDSFDEDAVVVGEIGLGGEVRPVPQLEQRLREAEKLGFAKAYVPAARDRSVRLPKSSVTIGRLQDFLPRFSAIPMAPTPGRRAA